jgi:hypothetical protein
VIAKAKILTAKKLRGKILIPKKLAGCYFYVKELML